MVEEENKLNTQFLSYVMVNTSRNDCFSFLNLVTSDLGLLNEPLHFSVIGHGGFDEEVGPVDREEPSDQVHGGH